MFIQICANRTPRRLSVPDFEAQGLLPRPGLYPRGRDVRAKDGRRGLTGSIATGHLLCRKGDENLVENSTIELLGNCTAYIENV